MRENITSTLFAPSFPPGTRAYPLTSTSSGVCVPGPAATMLLLHQVGSVKIGEVVRYTVTYTPSHDRILPSPEVLHLRIRNTSAVALRAAFVHGPYTLNVSAYPAHFDPNTKFENPRRYGVPEFEPMLKAGGNWNTQLVVPDDIRQSAGMGVSGGHFGAARADAEEASVSWVLEIASQVIFSASAAVGYEVLLARDEKSLNLNSVPVIGSQAQVPQPGRVSDFQQSIGAKDGHHPAQPKGLYSRAVKLKVEDTATLWNTPRLPGWDDRGHSKLHGPGKDNATASLATASAKPETSAKAEAEAKGAESPNDQREEEKTRRKKVHLVVLTHGLHSNLGADMLFMKESIDAAARQAKVDAKARRAREKADREAKRNRDQGKDPENGPANPSEGHAPEIVDVDVDDDGDDDEEVVVRGFSGNATRTERGIKYLGKRLARFILSMTYPDQPFLPITKTTTASLVDAFKADASGKDGKPAHRGSSIHDGGHHAHPDRAFQITSISFIGHSLGGLIQTYAIAYMQKHSPHFFDLIRPVNFIAMASPLLGLSNENPLYVKFALDFGLVGKTGQDLGLTWKAPTLMRSGWGALVSTLGENTQKKVMGEVQADSKPLLRILPTGPAHVALKKFRNRTVYSNVVNDGIVPLRTSCLLFLDWQGLERVEKARREAGLVERVVGFGWAELTGANVTSPRLGRWTPKDEPAPQLPPISPVVDPGSELEDGHEVPQPAPNAFADDDRQSLNVAPTPSQEHPPSQEKSANDGPLSNFFNFFKSGDNTPKSPRSPNPPTSPNLPAQKSRSPSPRQHRILKRSQTLDFNDASNPACSGKSKVTTGQELNEDSGSNLAAPPKTSFFESAGDILNPVLPSVEYLIDPSCRPRTIFHDRVYHPADIPPPPLKKRSTGLSMSRKSSARTPSASTLKKNPTGDSTSSSVYPRETSGLSAQDYDNRNQTDPERDPDQVIDSASMSVEEKIARAYHKGLSWRKVLVKLEPDAHNNIIVRRMFDNAHGWPVVKHLVDAHFSDSAAARMRNEDEANGERAKSLSQGPSPSGNEISTSAGLPPKGQKRVGSNGSASAPTPISADVSADGGEGGKAQKPQNQSEAREAEDAVSELPLSESPPSMHSSHSPPDKASHALSHLHSSPPRSRRGVPSHNGSPPQTPAYDRNDSMTWSERDWLDSQDESDSEDLAYPGHRRSKSDEERRGNGIKRTGSPSWNWTEKIVGKGASSKSRNPKSPTIPEPPKSARPF